MFQIKVVQSEILYKMIYRSVSLTQKLAIKFKIEIKVEPWSRVFLILFPNHSKKIFIPSSYYIILYIQIKNIPVTMCLVVPTVLPVP